MRFLRVDDIIVFSANCKEKIFDFFADLPKNNKPEFNKYLKPIVDFLNIKRDTRLCMHLWGNRMHLKDESLREVIVILSEESILEEDWAKWLDAFLANHKDIIDVPEKDVFSGEYTYDGFIAGKEICLENELGFILYKLPKLSEMLNYSLDDAIVWELQNNFYISVPKECLLDEFLNRITSISVESMTAKYVCDKGQWMSAKDFVEKKEEEGILL